MTQTQNLHLKKPDATDDYNVQDQNHNMDILDDNCVISEDVRTVRVMARSDYDALSTKNASVLYLVRDGDALTEYLGDIPVGGSTGTPVFGTASLMPNAAVIGENPVYGAAEMED